MTRLLVGAALVSVAFASYAPAATLAEDRACTMQAFADAPEIARDGSITGEALVSVVLNANGTVDKESIVKSSGNRWLDRAALRTAADARFSGDCGNGLIEVDFK